MNEVAETQERSPVDRWLPRIVALAAAHREELDRYKADKRVSEEPGDSPQAPGLPPERPRKPSNRLGRSTGLRLDTSSMTT